MLSYQEAGQSITDVALFSGIYHSVISGLWKQFQITKIVVRRPIAGHPRVTAPTVNRYIAILAKQNCRAMFTHMITMVTAPIAISAATVCRRLHMNGL